MKAVRRLFLGAVAATLVGCSATGPKFAGVSKPTGSEGTVVMYRIDQFVNGGAYPNVYIDGEKVGTLRNAGYAIYSLPAGRHDFRLANRLMWQGTQEWVVDLESETTQYFRILSDLRGVTVIGTVTVAGKSVRIESVAHADATNELRNLRLSVD